VSRRRDKDYKPESKAVKNSPKQKTKSVKLDSKNWTSKNKAKKENKEMEEDHSNGGNSSSSSCNLETSKADKAVWLMKCPVVVAKSWKSHHTSSSDSAPLAKVVLSLDPLQSDDPSALQVLFLVSICTQLF